MNVLKRYITTPENRIIKLKIPKSVPVNEPVEVILIFNEQKNSYLSKIKLLAQAGNDKNFIEDINMIKDNFKSVDIEGLDLWKIIVGAYILLTWTLLLDQSKDKLHQY